MQKIVQLWNFLCVISECLFESVYIATTAVVWEWVYTFLKLAEKKLYQ